jgi:L-lysine exporter family protein LysE/ArgO
MLGTVFFAIVQNSIDHGFKSGMYISLGVIISDIILIVISYYNANLIPEGGITEIIVRIAGAGFLIFLGVTNIMKKRSADFPVSVRKPALWLMFSGFTLNILNPGNLISWISLSAYLGNVMDYSNGERYGFYLGALCTIFLTEVLISYGAAYLKKFISNKLLNTINKVLGIIFLVFSVLVLIPLFQN